MNTINTLVNSIKKTLLLHGSTVYDHNLNRDVSELIGHEVSLTKNDINELLNHPLNDKYKPELHDIDHWYHSHFPRYSVNLHRRHVVYFNNNDHDNRLQCISLFQILDDWMIVYQRSSDTVKMIDDFRFFVAIRHYYFPHVNRIKINYGSLHTKLTNDE